MKRKKIPTVLGAAVLYGALAANLPHLVHAEGRDRQVVLSAEQAQFEFKNYAGENIDLNKNKVTHLVFMDIWASYEGGGVETEVAALPASFLKTSQQIWIQPEINVTRTQLAEFQQYYPQVAPLVLDESFKLMRANGIWQSPYHVLIKDGERVFAGDLSNLRRFLNIDEVPSVETVRDEIPALEVASSGVLPINTSSRYMKLKVGASAPAFSGETLSGKKQSLQLMMSKTEERGVSLIFLDSLCPMPHFPGCEAKLAELSQKIGEDPQRVWLGIVSSFYVDSTVARQFAERFDLRLPLIFDQGNQIFSQYGVHATPYQIDVSRSGEIEYRGADLH